MNSIKPYLLPATEQSSQIRQVCRSPEKLRVFAHDPFVLERVASLFSSLLCPIDQQTALSITLQQRITNFQRRRQRRRELILQSRQLVTRLERNCLRRRHDE